MPDRQQLVDEVSQVEVVASDVVFEGHIHSVVRERFAYNGDELMREFIRHPGAVAVLVLDDDDRMLVIQQYRHPIRSRDWELPAGLLDVAGEPLLEAAKRELAEEVDLVAREWFTLADVHTSPGGSDEFARIYLARGVEGSGEVFAREAEEADIVIRWVALDDVVASIAAGTVTNSLLVIGALAAHAARATGWHSLREAVGTDA